MNSTKRLTILNQQELDDLYSQPSFSKEDRHNFFALNDDEHLYLKKLKSCHVPAETAEWSRRLVLTPARDVVASEPAIISFEQRASRFLRLVPVVTFLSDEPGNPIGQPTKSV